MHRLALACILLAASIAAGVVVTHADTCDKCPSPSVMFYDSNAESLRPADTSLSNPAAVDFMSLYFTGLGIMNGVFQFDPTRPCTRIFSAGFDEVRRTISPGSPTFPNLPVPGAPGGQSADYMVESTVTGAPGAFTLKGTLEDSQTREAVSTGTVTFARSIDALQAGVDVARQLGPVLERIRAFQKGKRDANTATAIHAKLELTALAQQIEVGKKTEVTLVLKDCDDTLLKNRPITLKISGNAAKVDPTSVTTDARGRATVTVTGLNPGPAKLVGSWAYTDVIHHKVHAWNAVTIRVAAPADIWEMELVVEAQEEYRKVKETTTRQFTGQWIQTLDEQITSSRMTSKHAPGMTPNSCLIEVEKWEG